MIFDILLDLVNDDFTRHQRKIGDAPTRMFEILEALQEEQKKVEQKADVISSMFFRHVKKIQEVLIIV